MSASRAWESGFNPAGAHHVAEGAAGGFGCQEPLKSAGFSTAHGEAADVHRIGEGLSQRDTHGCEGGGAGGHLRRLTDDLAAVPAVSVIPDGFDRAVSAELHSQSANENPCDTGRVFAITEPIAESFGTDAGTVAFSDGIEKLSLSRRQLDPNTVNFSGLWCDAELATDERGVRREVVATVGAQIAHHAAPLGQPC